MNTTMETVDFEACTCSDITHADYSTTYAWFNLVVIILAMPIVSAFGMCSNVVNVYFYTRPSLINSSNCYLAALGVSDFFVVVTGLFIFWIDSARSYLPSLKYAPYTIVYTLPIGYMAQTCSVYFTVAAAIDCYVNVCWSPFFSTWCTVARAKQVIAAVVIGSIVYNSLRFGQFELKSCLPEFQNHSIIEICPTNLFFEINTVYNVYMYMILMTFLPFLLLSILNALIVNRVKVKTESAAVSTQSGPAAPPPSSDDTITMVMVVVLFLICNTLALVVNIVETFFEPDQLVLNYMTDTSNFLVILNSSVNFIIYMIFAQEFRRLFVWYFLCGKNRKARSASIGYGVIANPHCTELVSPHSNGRPCGDCQYSLLPTQDRTLSTEILLTGRDSPVEKDPNVLDVENPGSGSGESMRKVSTVSGIKGIRLMSTSWTSGISFIDSSPQPESSISSKESSKQGIYV